MLGDFGSPSQCVSFTVKEGESESERRTNGEEREEGGEEKDCRDGGQGREA